MQKTDIFSLLIGGCTIPLFIGGFQIMDEHPLAATILFTLAGLALILCIYLLVFHKRRKKSKTKSTKNLKQIQLPTINYEKLGTITEQDKDLIQHMAIRMWSTHGHQDLMGLMSDRANGVAINDLMIKPCSECGLPRNKRGRE